MSSKPAKQVRRLLLKISGEALSGDSGVVFDDHSCHAIVDEVISIHKMGIEVGLVIGGGNIFRGQQQAERFGFHRVAADYVGLLATTINAMIFSQLLTTKGASVAIFSSKGIEGVVDSYNWHESMAALSEGRIVIFAGGTGNPFFTTDSAAALRACEMDADILVKATKVDGVYDADPVKHSDAKKFNTLTYDDVLRLNLKVMDATAISLCREKSLPIVVLNLFERGSLQRLVSGEKIGTCILASSEI